MTSASLPLTTPPTDTNADALIFDRFTPPEPRSSPRIRTLTLILVRHGETEWNADGRIQGHLDVPLSVVGRDQALGLGRRFGAACRPTDFVPLLPYFSGAPLAIFAQFSSDLRRASETAQIVRGAVPSFEQAPLLITPLLRERNFGDWQGLGAEELRVRRADGGGDPPNGETEAQVFERMRQALYSIASHAATPPGAAAQNVMVYGHGGSLRALLCMALGIGAGGMRRFRLENTSLSVVEISGLLNDAEFETQNGRLVCFNETAHLLAPETRTGN